jgi:DNA-binding transcriptional ArsR family regulator
VRVQDVALRAIASQRRRTILRLVWDEERSSGEIASQLDVSWPAVSQNLRVLEDAGLIRNRRVGTTRLYRADRQQLRPLRAVLTKMWEADLDRLTSLAEAEFKANKSRGSKP